MCFGEATSVQAAYFGVATSMQLSLGSNPVLSQQVVTKGFGGGQQGLLCLGEATSV